MVTLPESQSFDDSLMDDIMSLLNFIFDDLYGYSYQISQGLGADKQPGEPKDRGHVTITHQRLALTFLAFCTRSRLRSDLKKLRRYVQDFSELFPYLFMF